MRTELPVCKRCCFCLPLRFGLLTWGYLRLIISIFFLTGMSIGIYRMMKMATTDIVYSIISGFLILLAVTDIVLNALFIVGAHKKSLKLLRTYYIYSFILCILTSLLGIASCVYTVLLFEIGQLNLTFHIWIILVDTATMLAQVLAQVYALLLVRSEVIKLRNHCEFRFVNNAAEAECTLNYEESNGKEGPE